MKEPSSKFLILHDTPEYVYIVDTGENVKSITNDAKAIVRFLYSKHQLGNRRLIYRDSSGQRDEILHEKGKFLDFSPGFDGIPDLPNYNDEVPLKGVTEQEKSAETNNAFFYSIFVKFVITSRYFFYPAEVLVKWDFPYIPRVGETVSGWVWIESKHIKLENLYINLSADGQDFFEKSGLDFVNWLYEVSIECDIVSSIDYVRDCDIITPCIYLSEDEPLKIPK